MRRLASPGWIASHIFVVAMVVLMVNLGLWQLRRLDERQADNAQIAAAMARSPLDASTLAGATGDLSTDDISAGDSAIGDTAISAGDSAAGDGTVPAEYTAVTATGAYMPAAEVRIANRSSGGQPGSWLATPLVLADGRAVVVVRGWVPRRALAGLDERRTDAPPGVVTVEGLAFAGVDGGRVALTDPGEPPEISRMDLHRFSEVTGVEVADYWIRLRNQWPPQPEQLPVPVPDPDLTEGPHLSYAFQWFFFSAGTVVVYALILRRTAKGRDEAPALV